jgi:hypothetical protein
MALWGFALLGSLPHLPVSCLNQFPPNNPCQHACHGNTRQFRVVVGLQIGPALRVRAKKYAQAQGSVHGNAAHALHDYIDAPG